jgi:fibronectin type 3 domain-containing protein
MNQCILRAARPIFVLILATALLSGCSNIFNNAFKDNLGAKKIITGTASVSAQSIRTWVKVSWVALDGASSYDVYRGSTKVTSDMKKIGSTANTSYTDSDSNLGTNSTYYYSVRAVNSIGSSPYSSPVPCTTGYKLTADLKAQESASGISLSWTLSESISETPTYILYRGTSNVTSAMTAIAQTQATTYDDTPPAKGNYYYAVKVSIPGYVGDFSYVKSATY